MVLRDYQLRCLDSIRKGWGQFARQLVVICTGGGKTIIFAHAAKESVDAGGKVLVLAHTEELIDQAIDKIMRATGLECGKEKAREEATLIDPVVVASVQTLSREPRLIAWGHEHFSLIIVDEAHHVLAESYLKILNWFPKARVLGFTATADRGDKRSLAEVFENVAFEYSLINAVSDGWLVRPLVRTVPVKIDMTGVKSSRTQNGYDFDAQEVSHRLEPLIESMCAALVGEIGNRKTLVYVPSVHLAQMAAQATRQHGVTTQFVSGACADRAEKTIALREGDVQVTFNAQLYIEGFDDSGVSCISVWRPTKIRSLLAQCVGRGTRPLDTLIPNLDRAPDAGSRRWIIGTSQKPNVLLLDFLWLTDRLSLIRPTDLVVTNAAIAEHAAKIPQQGDLLELAEAAARDYLKSLEEAVRKNEQKKARLIDPLACAVMVHDEDLETYEPASRWEMRGPSDDQKKLLAQLGINPGRVATFGLAHMLIGKLLARRRLGLCTVQQMTFLRRLGLKEETALVSRDEAKKKIDARLAELRSRDPRARPPAQLEMAVEAPEECADVPE